MFGYEKQDTRIIITRPDGKTIIFENDGTIIGASGRKLKNRPKEMGEVCYSIAANGRLNEIKSFINHYYDAYYISSRFGFDNEEIENMLERIFKVFVNNVYDYMHYHGNGAEIVFDCFNVSWSICSTIKNSEVNGLNEKNFIEFLNKTHYYSNNPWDAIKAFKKWHISKRFWSQLPPINYPEYLTDICNDFLMEFNEITDEVIECLKTGVKNHQLENMYFFYREMVNKYGTTYKIANTLYNYYCDCKQLGESPSFSGNFINKFADIARKKEAKKDEIFAKKQNKRNLHFEDDNFIVVIPQTIGALIDEGKAQNNCVGHYGYDERVMKDICNIVFIRQKTDIDSSYITCEIDKHGHIEQYLAKNNHTVYDTKALDFKDAYSRYLVSIW